MLQVASDLHLEQWLPRKPWSTLLKPVAPTLALVGDTCPLEHRELWTEFLHFITPQWKTILIVNGNHEFYSLKYTVGELKKWQNTWPYKWKNVHVLDCDAYDLGSVRILGCTLWSHIPLWAQKDVGMHIGDYSMIRLGHGPNQALSCRDVNRWHQQHVTWIFAQLEKHPCTPHIILTHHAPLNQGTSNPIYEQQGNRLLNHAFSSDLQGLVQTPGIMTWVFGHTHYKCDFQCGPTRILSNPSGSPHQILGYENNLSFPGDSLHTRSPRLPQNRTET